VFLQQNAYLHVRRQMVSTQQLRLSYRALKFQFQYNAVFNKHDILKFCNEWQKHWNELRLITQM